MAVKTNATYAFSFPTLGDMANAVVKEVSAVSRWQAGSLDDSYPAVTGAC
jgi:hypothetical protein